MEAPAPTGSTAPLPGGPPTTGGPAPGSPGPLPPATTSTGPTGAASPPSTTVAPGRLSLGGTDLGVTRVGAPLRDAVAAVSAVLGRPVGDPAPDTACIGAEDETSWGSFRLAGTAGTLSGWLSTSRTLVTPAGVTVGTALPALRSAYGSRLEIRPPAPDASTVFVVAGAGLGGTLSGESPADTVTSLSVGTCEGT